MCEEFFSKHDLEIQIIDSVYTDNAPAMLGNIFCFVEQDNSHLQGTHCFLCRHFNIKIIAHKIKNVIDSSVKAINWIKGRALNHHLLKSFC